MTKPRSKKPGTVRRIIKAHPGAPEKAEIVVHGADELYKEIRIENSLEDAQGHKRKLKENAEVEVTIEADPAATVPEPQESDGTHGKFHHGG